MTGLDWGTVFVVANVFQFAFGVAITALSYRAYCSNGRKPSLRNATVGFGCITVGGVLAPVYELGLQGDYSITGRELLGLQILEGTVIGVGLAFLLLAVYGHSRRPAGQRRVEVGVADGGRRDDP